LDIIIKTYQELTKEELYDLLKLRTDIFVVEQNCPYPELDNKDQIAIHVLGMKAAQIAAYTRIFGVNDYFANHAAIGRIATNDKFRGQNLGRDIVKASIDYCWKLYGKESLIKISAQTYLTTFYESFGFQIEGDEFLEDGIPHIHMVL
jgi:ElaA protein